MTKQTLNKHYQTLNKTQTPIPNPIFFSSGITDFLMCYFIYSKKNDLGIVFVNESVFKKFHNK